MIIQVMHVYGIKDQISVKLIKKGAFPCPTSPSPWALCSPRATAFNSFLAVSYGYLHFSKYSAYTAVF